MPEKIKIYQINFTITSARGHPDAEQTTRFTEYISTIAELNNAMKRITRIAGEFGEEKIENE